MHDRRHAAMPLTPPNAQAEGQMTKLEFVNRQTSDRGEVDRLQAGAIGAA